MQIVRIPKGKGKYRTIYMPDKQEKEKLRGHLEPLMRICQARCPANVVHGFMPNRSPVTNAAAHIGFHYTLSFDLKDFFDTVTWRHVIGIIPDAIIDDVIIDGAARQGLPTSPVVSNIAAAKMDWDILELIEGHNVRYTRYADDMTLSYNQHMCNSGLRSQLKVIVEKHRFVLNEKKTKLQTAKAGRRIITGVGVDDYKIYPTRRAKRKLRAARHQKKRASANGLAEWCKLKAPAGAADTVSKQIEELRRLLGLFNANENVDPGEFSKEQRRIEL